MPGYAAERHRRRGADIAIIPHAAAHARAAATVVTRADIRGALAADAAEPPANRGPEIEKALGDALFALVDAARQLRCDPELALRAAAREFRERLDPAS